MKEYHKALESYKKGLAIDGDSQLCKQGLQKTSQAINASSAGGGGMSEDEQRQRAERGMADPEIQGILQDPVVRQVLQDLSGGDAMAGQRAWPTRTARMEDRKRSRGRARTVTRAARRPRARAQRRGSAGAGFRIDASYGRQRGRGHPSRALGPEGAEVVFAPPPGCARCPSR